MNLKIVRFDFEIKYLRGNIYIRFKKLEIEDYDVIVLVVVGFKRIGLVDKIIEYLNGEVFLFVFV